MEVLKFICKVIESACTCTCIRVLHVCPTGIALRNQVTYSLYSLHLQSLSVLTFDFGVIFILSSLHTQHTPAQPGMPRLQVIGDFTDYIHNCT